MIIGLSGFSRTGKDSVAGILQRKYGYVIISLAEPVRDIALHENPPVQGKGAFKDLRMLLSQWIAALAYDLNYDDVRLWDILKEHTEIAPVLQHIGMRGRKQDENHWLDIAKKRIRAFRELRGCQDFVIPDVRLTNEYEYIRSEGGLLWQITRPGTGPMNGMQVESEHLGFKFDQVICNSGTLAALDRQVSKAIQPIIAT